MDPNNTKTPEDDTSPVDALMAGVEAAGGEFADDVVEQEPAEGAAPAKAEGEPEGEPPAADKAGDAPAAAKPDAPKPDTKPEGEPDKRPSDEFGELPKDAKAETRERFEKLREGYDALHKEVQPLREALTAAGIKDVAELPKVIARAKDADDLIGMVAETGATSEQYGQALDYLTLVNQAAKGDTKAAEQAYAVMEKELQALGSMLGKDVPGVQLPADLAAEVEAGDLTRQRALEIAAARTREQTVTQHRTQEDQQNEQRVALKRGSDALNAWDAQRLADPVYLAKRPQLLQLANYIKQTLPPAKWLEAVEKAYAAIPAPAPAPTPAPRVGPVPVRGTGHRVPLEQAEFDDPTEAMMAGIAAASR